MRVPNENNGCESATPRWFHFRRRILLKVVLVLMVLFSIWWTFFYKYQVNHDINRLARGDCEYDQWYNITGANLSGVDMDQSVIDKIAQLRHMRWLIVGGHAFNNRALEQLKTLTQLELLLLDSTKATREEQAKLQKSLPNLRIYESTWRAVAELMTKYKKEKADKILPYPNISFDYRIPADMVPALKDFKKYCILPERGVLLEPEEIGEGFGNYGYAPNVAHAYVDNRDSFEYSQYFKLNALAIKGSWFTDSDIVMMSTKNLAVVFLINTGVTSKGIEKLKHLPYIRMLKVDNTIIISRAF
jgi:hypothetical protein